MYEVVAEPQVPQGQALQREVHEESAQGPVHPVLSSSSKASPGAQPINLNYDTYIYVFITYALRVGVVETLVA